MTAFVEQNFYNDGSYLRYMFLGQSHFIGRFKYSKSPITKSRLKRVLIKHYDVESYIKRVKDEAPLQILMTDGYLEYLPEERKFRLDGKII